MFIRKTRKTDRKTRKDYYSYQLVESVRTERGPRQRILLSLSADLGLTEENLGLLAHRIEEIFLGSNSLFSPPDEIECLAQKYASQLILRLSQTPPLPPENQEPDYHTIDLQTVEQQEPRTVGTEHLLLHMASQLQIQKKLRDLGLSEKEVALSLGSLIGRAAFPASERATYTWLCSRTGLGELLEFDFSRTSLDQLYEISDVLLKHKEELETYLEKTQQAVHGYKSTMVLYDLTNTYMEGQNKSNPKAAHGVSKEKRGDCPLITLGLVVNEHGFATRTSFLPGNISELGTLQQMIKALGVDDSLLKPTVVLDAGISSEDNLKWLRDHGYTYVVSARENAPSMELEGPLTPVGDLEKTNVKAALVKNDGGEERWLYCESEAKRIVASQMRELFQHRFEFDLKKLNAGLVKPKGRKKYTKILERIGRLKEKHKRVSGCYEIVVDPSKDGLQAIAVRWTLQPEKIEERLNGYYFLRTNLIHLGAEELWTLYDSIRTVEDAFRFMKSSLGMRPVYHQKEHRVDGHLWITVLAYHLIRSCIYQLNQQGLVYHWETIRNKMSGRVRVTMRAKTRDGLTMYHRSTTKAEWPQQEIYQALGMSTQILKAKKTVI